MTKVQKNVLGENLENCSNNPLTGWYRDGCCNTDKNDRGVHTVCAKVTDEFLQWSKKGVALQCSLRESLQREHIGTCDVLLFF